MHTRIFGISIITVAATLAALALANRFGPTRRALYTDDKLFDGV